MYRQLKELYPLHACEQFNSILPLMERYCGYSEEGIPQLEDISQVWNNSYTFSHSKCMTEKLGIHYEVIIICFVHYLTQYSIHI